MDVLKAPRTDASKASLPGVLAVKRVGGIPTAFPAELVAPEENMLQVRVGLGWPLSSADSIGVA